MGETAGFTSIDLHPSNELTHRFVLQGLQKFTSYQVVLQGYNKQGLGPSSEAAVATTMEDGKKNYLDSAAFDGLLETVRRDRSKGTLVVYLAIIRPASAMSCGQKMEKRS